MRELVLAVLLVVSIACTAAPKETVELAEIVDQQIAQMQVSHERFVSLYYSKLRDDVNRFIEERFIPTLLEIAIDPERTDAGAEFRRDLDQAYRLATVDPEAVGIAIDENRVTDPALREALQAAVEQAIAKGRAELGGVLIDFSQGIAEQIEAQRREMLTPINEQEAFVLAHLREGYADLQRGSAAIKAYLVSVVKLREERDAVLRKLGLLETQRKLVRAAVAASDDASKLLETAEDADAGIASFLEALESAKEDFRRIAEGQDGDESEEREKSKPEEEPVPEEVEATEEEGP